MTEAIKIGGSRNRCPKCEKKLVGEDDQDERCGDGLCWCSDDDESSPTGVEDEAT